MTETQLNLLGDRAQPTDLALGPVQRLVLEFARTHGTVSKDEAGALAHAHRGKHSADEVCRFCSIDGAPLLRTLVKRGLLTKRRDGLAELPTPKPGPGDLPEGF